MGSARRRMRRSTRRRGTAEAAPDAPDELVLVLGVGRIGERLFDGVAFESVLDSFFESVARVLLGPEVGVLLLQRIDVALGGQGVFVRAVFLEAVLFEAVFFEAVVLEAVFLELVAGLSAFEGVLAERVLEAVGKSVRPRRRARRC